MPDLLICPDQRVDSGVLRGKLEVDKVITWTSQGRPAQEQKPLIKLSFNWEPIVNFLCCLYHWSKLRIRYWIIQSSSS